MQILGWQELNEYGTSYGYDPNGNVTNIVRRANANAANDSLFFDDLQFSYTGGGNRLDHVIDARLPATEAIDGDLQTQTPQNYTYDATGNLIADAGDGISSITWNQYGKVQTVNKANGTNVVYGYDAVGNRVSETEADVTGRLETSYVYDAGGTVVAIYKQYCVLPGQITPDVDHDGIPDNVDNCLNLFNPDQADADADGLGDACDPDIDNDGLLNIRDGCPWDAANGCRGPAVDFDMDGLVDAADPCPCNPVNNCPPVDSDGDGIIDAKDPCPCNPIPPCMVVADYDSDGKVDGVDPLPGNPNTDSTDTDNDGIPDVVDPDIDGDGYPNEHDNCPWENNPNQEDTDGDGTGDACDETPNGYGCGIVEVEFPIYGLSREGIAQPNINWAEAPPDTIYRRHVREKVYEIVDHLGNVREVLSDVKLSNGQAGTSPFHADLLGHYNYYPYGMLQPGRYVDPSYRYGFNGMETDGAVTGQRNHSTTFFRQYDARMGRWWSNDPITHSWESPYAAMAGNPIVMSDVTGAEPSESSPLEPGCSDCPSAETTTPGTVFASDDFDNYRLTQYHDWVIGEMPALDALVISAQGEKVLPGTARYNSFGFAHVYHNGEWVSEADYRQLVQALVDNTFNESFDPAELGFFLWGDVTYGDHFWDTYNLLGRQTFGYQDYINVDGSQEPNPFAAKGIDNNEEDWWFPGAGKALFKIGAGIFARMTLSPAVTSELRNMFVYIARNEEGDVIYVGITNSMTRRASEHAKRFTIGEIAEGLTLFEARGLEQVLIERYGMSKFGLGGTLQNLRNSISPLNPIYADAKRAGLEILKRTPLH